MRSLTTRKKFPLLRLHEHTLTCSKSQTKFQNLTNRQILLLIGRDVPPLHKVHESCNGSRNAPWGQRLDLGWVVLGNTCLNGAHNPEQISTCKTQVLHNSRPSLFVPCPNRFHVKFDTNQAHPSLTANLTTA